MRPYASASAPPPEPGDGKRGARSSTVIGVESRAFSPQRSKASKGHGGTGQSAEEVVAAFYDDDANEASRLVVRAPPPGPLSLAPRPPGRSRPPRPGAPDGRRAPSSVR